MRPLPSAAVLALLLPTATALAEPGGAWIDPPARPAAGVAAPAADPAPGADRAAASGSAQAASRPERVAPEQPHRRETAQRKRDGQPRPLAGRVDVGVTDAAADRAGAARRLVEAYLASISSENARTLAATPGFYGQHVRFHGRTMTTDALIAQKRSFFRRWPERRYTALPDGMRAACTPDGVACTVNTLMGFRATSPERGARSQGVSELTVTVSFAGGRAVIASESSRVVRRGSAALEAVERGRSGA